MSNIVTRILNEVDHRPDILDCIANLSSDEVFTPPNMVDRVLDALPEEVWSNPSLKWLDPATKTGVFLRQVTYRLMIGLKDKFPDEEERRQHIFQNMIYGIGITELTALMARRSLYTSKNASSKESVAHFESPNGNIDYENRTHTYVNGNCKYCGNKETDAQLGGRGEDQERHAYKFIHLTAEEASKMKFDVIVGNPPYQLNDGGGTGSSAIPIYQKFVDQAKKLNPRYMAFIIPSRWFAGGKGLDNFRAEMLKDRRIKIVYDYPNAEDCFPGVSIIGGVMYFIWDSSYSGDCEVHTIINDEELPVSKRPLNEFEVFVRYNSAVPIIRKVRERHEETLDKVVLPRNPFRMPSGFSDFDQINNPDKIKIYARGNTGYVRRERVQSNTNLIDKYKVLVSKGDGAAIASGRIIGKPIIADNPSCSTETYLVAGIFKSQEEAKNYAEYMKTKFYRFLVSIKKNTQNMSQGSFAFVPNLPMDQVWTDKKLYERYDLTPAEQKFIESMIKEMN